MSKTNEAATRMTLSDSGLHGYNGPVDIVVRRPRPWWRRLLRLKATTHSERVYVDVNGDTARAWRKP